MSEISTSGGHQKSSMCSPGSHVAKQQLALPPYWGPQWGLQWRHPRCPVQSCRGWGSAQCLWRGWDANSRHDKDFKLQYLLEKWFHLRNVIIWYDSCFILGVFSLCFILIISHWNQFCKCFCIPNPQNENVYRNFKMIIYSTKQYKTSKHLVIHHASTDDP